jgi:hypothetical protein
MFLLSVAMVLECSFVWALEGGGIPDYSRRTLLLAPHSTAFNGHDEDDGARSSRAGV